MTHQSTALLLLSLGASTACSSGSKDGISDSLLTSSLVKGVIFKGPFEAGSVITLSPLTDALDPNGDVQSLTVDADDGSYSAEVELGGLVFAEATGYALDESRGEKGPVTVTLGAYAMLGAEEEEIHVNLFTDLIRNRVEALIAEGSSPEDAISTAERELTDALPVGAGGPPDAHGAALDPYGDGYPQAWLFGVSAVLAQTGMDMESEGAGSLGDLMASLREDLADDGALSEDLTEAIYIGETRLDPDLATLALTSTLAGAGMERTPPDIHAALDSDHDGRPNNDDNCRYVANADQYATRGFSFGDACDYRLSALSVNDRWGCGVALSDGAPVCWAVDGEPTGGTPPAPDVYPAHATTPWEGEDKLTGAYVDISVGDQVTCALTAEGEARCDVDGDPIELVLDGSFVAVVASRTTICGLGADGALSCFDPSGALLVSDPGPYQDVDVFSEGGLCVMDDDGDLSWVDYPDASTDLPALPSGYYATLDASEAGAGCAISATDGTVSCFGNAALTELAPTGSFNEVAVGAGVACASNADGALNCWRDESLCPDVEEAPTHLWNISAGGCQVCGLDEEGVGTCWPRRWSVDHASAG